MTPQPGDIACCWGGDLVSRAISLVTMSFCAPPRLWRGPSHVAMMSALELGGPLLWWESTALCDRPCLLQDAVTRGCQVHDIDDRAEDYLSHSGRIDIYRLGDMDRLTEDEHVQLGEMLGRLVTEGKRYDFAGAAVSGTRLLRFCSCLRGQLGATFCSEMIAAVLMRLNRLPRRNATHYSPARLMRSLVDAGTYRYLTTMDAPRLRIHRGSDDDA